MLMPEFNTGWYRDVFPTPEDWFAQAERSKLHPVLIAYLRGNPHLLNPENEPDAPGIWVRASHMLYAEVPMSIWECVIGLNRASELRSFVINSDEERFLPIEDILAGVEITLPFKIEPKTVLTKVERLIRVITEEFEAANGDEAIGIAQRRADNAIAFMTQKLGVYKELALFMVRTLMLGGTVKLKSTLPGFNLFQQEFAKLLVQR